MKHDHDHSPMAGADLDCKSTFSFPIRPPGVFYEVPKDPAIVGGRFADGTMFFAGTGYKLNPMAEEFTPNGATSVVIPNAESQCHICGMIFPSCSQVCDWCTGIYHTIDKGTLPLERKNDPQRRQNEILHWWIHGDWYLAQLAH